MTSDDTEKQATIHIIAEKDQKLTCDEKERHPHRHPPYCE
jgi:hypothetical protein